MESFLFRIVVMSVVISIRETENNLVIGFIKCQKIRGDLF